jgi:hypothetical protein
MKIVCALLATALVLPVAAQDQEAIDRAIDRGAAFLKQKVADPKWDDPAQVPKGRSGSIHPNRPPAELILWTLMHAGVPEKDPAFQKLLKICVEQPMWRTYNVSLLAMCLQKLDAAGYQSLIAQCGQFFADTQCDTGQWSYGQDYKPSGSVDRRALPPRKKDEGSTQGGSTVKIKRGGSGQAPKDGDNSNSQYAALGIRACHLAGVELPEETLKRGCAWWEKNQKGDGSWAYGTLAKAREINGYGSMTAGAIGSVAILKTLLKAGIENDRTLQKGFDWLAKNFTCKENPGYSNRYTDGRVAWYYYYLYAIERAGDLTSSARFGTHDWYAVGAKQLLGIQKPDGSWKEPSQENEIQATCFAVLFLKRATEPLIKTGDEKPPVKKDSPR